MCGKHFQKKKSLCYQVNGNEEKIDGTKSWDVSNWGLNKEEIQQTQNEISQKNNGLSTDKNEIETLNDIVERQ